MLTRLVAGFALSVQGVVAAPLFDDHSVLEVSLTGPLGALFAAKESSAYLPFTLQAEGVVYPIKVRVRGNSRQRVCEFPPLRLNFRHEDAGQTLFRGQDKLKLVTHCRNGNRGEQDLLEEYLAYRILNILAETSLRVRLLRIDYQDTGQHLPDEASPRFGFLIESLEEFAQRTGMTAVTMPGVPVGGYDLEHANRVFVFQYLIGNTDWGLVKADHDEGCCHNVDLFERNGQIMLVPYDFDLSGLVNARYAFPDRTLRIKRVTQRLYRGVCSDPETMQRAIRAVGAHRDEILSLVRTLPGLTPDNAAIAQKYIQGYFETAENEDELIRYFQRHCL